MDTGSFHVLIKFIILFIVWLWVVGYGFACVIKYQYKKTKKNIFVYFYLLIFYFSTKQPDNTNVFLFIDVLFSQLPQILPNLPFLRIEIIGTVAYILDES